MVHKNDQLFFMHLRVQLILAGLHHARVAQLAQSHVCMLAPIHTCLIFFLVPAEKPRQVLLMVTVETQEHKQIHRQWYTATSALFYCPKLVTCLAQYQSPRVPQRYGGSEELTPSIQPTSMIGKFGSRAVRW